ncbi:MAG: low molecular weight phosphotyrosine protein phosphatase [Actinomycetota bacterium]|jgi:protein-tyrosine phosphatase|nr:low molecular weight phosphotyrosine protein phosphatase [Actinomycetota bacterium]MDQ3453176.1 low molecular weight phosphotyrosine protein phosphatase [Actinomycetota bacterium]
MRILLVCLGNICRSPTAEAALREALAEAGMSGVEVDSAGTGDWHLGDPPDERMTAAAAAVGLTLTGAARLLDSNDFGSADLILVMDHANLTDVRALARDEADRSKVHLFREFDDRRDADDVPDPYFGDAAGFAHVVDITRAAAKALVRRLQTIGIA